jgi:hypothetical protein
VILKRRIRIARRASPSLQVMTTVIKHGKPAARGNFVGNLLFIIFFWAVKCCIRSYGHLTFWCATQWTRC